MSLIVKYYWKFLKSRYYKSYINQKKIRSLPLDKIREIQWERLRKLINYAYKHSIFYQESFDSVNLTPDNIKSYEDFKKIPYIDKKIIKKNYNKIMRIDCNKQDYIVAYTSGSTGEPFPFCIDKNREVINTYTAFMLNKEMVGINSFKKNNEIMIKAEPINEIKNLSDFNNDKSFSQKIKYFFSTETFGIKSIDIKKENIETIASIIKKNNIVGIYGYSSNILYLARYFSEFNIKINLDYIILMAESLLKQQKQFISKTFNCPVYMDYGASECMRMGFECKHNDGYHMDLFNYYFEYLDDNGNEVKPGEEANIIVTNLNNFIFPLIRYKIGDLCIFSDDECPSDNNYPIINDIFGRKSEVLQIDADNEISILNFHVYFEYLFEYILQYQIIFDEKSKNILIKIVPNKRPNDKKIEEIKKDILKLINYSADVDIKIVKKIPFGVKGKTNILIYNR